MTQRSLEFDPVRKVNITAEVRSVMIGGSWTTPLEVKQVLAFRGVHASDSSITARIRDLRKTGLTVEKRPKSNDSSQWEYRVVMQRVEPRAGIVTNQ